MKFDPSLMMPSVSGCIKDVPHVTVLHCMQTRKLLWVRTQIFLSKVFVKVGYIQPSFWPKNHTGPFIRWSHTRWPHYEWLGSSARGSVVRRECSREEPGGWGRCGKIQPFIIPWKEEKEWRQGLNTNKNRNEKKKKRFLTVLLFVYL